MSKTESWKNWLVIIVVIVALGVVTAIWPSISAGLGGGGGANVSTTRLPYEAHPIVLEIPEVALPTGAVAGGQEIVFDPPFMAVVAVTAVTVGLVLGMGLVLGLFYVLLARMTARTMASESYQEHAQALENKEKEKLKEKRAGRDPDPMRPNPTMPRWSMLANGLIIVMFVVFGGMVLVSTFYPERLIEVGSELINPALILVGIPLLMTLAILIFAPRWGTAVLALLFMALVALASLAVIDITGVELSASQSLSVLGLVQLITLAVLAYIWKPTPAGMIEEKVILADQSGGEKGIPYDAIVVLITGLFVVGLGVGIMVLINSAYWEQIRQLLGL